MGRREGLDDPVGRRQDARPRTEVRVEGELGRGRPVGPGEVGGELEEVEQAGPTPRVDVLVGIAHRGHGEASAEHGPEQGGLGHVGVLVFVEHHGVEPRAVVLHHLREALHDVEGQRDLVTEVDHSERSLQLLEPPRRAGQLDALGRRLPCPFAPGRPERREPALVEGDHLFGRPAVVRHLVGEGEDLVHHRGLPLHGELFELDRRIVEDPGAHLGPLGPGEDPPAGLDACQQPVPFDDLRREPVIVQDRGLLSF